MKANVNSYLCALVATLSLSASAFAAETFAIPAEANVDGKIVVAVDDNTGKVEFLTAEGQWQAITPADDQAALVNPDSLTEKTAFYGAGGYVGGGAVVVGGGCGGCGGGWGGGAVVGGCGGCGGGWVGGAVIGGGCNCGGVVAAPAPYYYQAPGVLYGGYGAGYMPSQTYRREEHHIYEYNNVTAPPVVAPVPVPYGGYGAPYGGY